MYGGKFAFQNRLASLQLAGNLPFLLCFTLYLRAISKYKPPRGLILEGLIQGGAYFSGFYGTFAELEYLSALI